MFPHLWFAPEEMALRVEELRREAEIDRLGRRRLAAREHPRSRRLLHGLGRSLVSLGQRLEQYGSQPCPPLELGMDCATGRGNA